MTVPINSISFYYSIFPGSAPWDMEVDTMACESEQKHYDAVFAKLERLQEELANAAPSDKPRIIKKINEQLVLEGQASAALEACLAAHKDPPADIGAIFSVVFESNHGWGQFHEYNVKRVFRFRGPAEARELWLDDIVVVRTATTTISGLHGILNKVTGSMSLSAVVAVPFFPDVYGGEVLLTTGSAKSKNGRFAPIGHALSGTDFRLVGTGFQSKAGIDLEFQVIVEGTFDAAP